MRQHDIGDVLILDEGRLAGVVDTAVRVMRTAAVRRVPVVDPDGRVEGVVSIGDLAVAQDSNSALADISAAPPKL